MAMLAKQCVEKDPVLRPDMKQVVIPSHKSCCPLLSGKLLLPGTARYSAVLSREDSLNTNIIFAHYSIIFSSPFYNRNTIKYELRLDIETDGSIVFYRAKF